MVRTYLLHLSKGLEAKVLNGPSAHFCELFSPPVHLLAINIRSTVFSLERILILNLLQAVHILETYFDIDEGEDQNLAPAVDSQVRYCVPNVLSLPWPCIKAQSKAVNSVYCILLGL